MSQGKIYGWMEIFKHGRKNIDSRPFGVPLMWRCKV